jgi:hypothetical protein
MTTTPSYLRFLTSRTSPFSAEELLGRYIQIKFLQKPNILLLKVFKVLKITLAL